MGKGRGGEEEPMFEGTDEEHAAASKIQATHRGKKGREKAKAARAGKAYYNRVEDEGENENDDKEEFCEDDEGAAAEGRGGARVPVEGEETIRDQGTDVQRGTRAKKKRAARQTSALGGGTSTAEEITRAPIFEPSVEVRSTEPT